MINESKKNSGGAKVVARRQGVVIELRTSQMRPYTMLQSVIRTYHVHVILGNLLDCRTSGLHLLEPS
jgi:hypothetical protein